MSRDSTRRLSPSFKVREFACKGSDVVLLDDELVVLLQCIREHFGKPVHITSGYRTAAHNAAVGGSKSSQHLLGRAADFYVEGVDVATVAAYAETLLPSRGGIGRYLRTQSTPPARPAGYISTPGRIRAGGVCEGVIPMQFILEYWAQWAFALMGGAVLAAIPKIKALWQAVLALLHDRIYTECYHFLSLGHITPDGLRNLTYLYKTYHTMGGNGTGTELYNRAKALPIHD